MASRQRTIGCEECDCVIDDARSIVGINDISGCPEPFSSVYWTFYGYEGRVLGYRRHDSCCNATLRVTYVPIAGLTSTITSEYSTSSSTRSTHSTVPSSSSSSSSSSLSSSSASSTRRTPTSTRTTITSRQIGTHTQNTTTTTNGDFIPVTPSRSGGITLDRNILFYGLAGVLSVILLVLIISFLLWLRRNKNRKRMTLKEEDSSSDSGRTPNKPKDKPLTSFKAKEPLQSEYSMIDTGDGNAYFLIEKQTDKIVDIKLDKTISMMSLVDPNEVPDGAYYLLEGPSQTSTENDNNLEVYMEIPYQDIGVVKKERNDDNENEKKTEDINEETYKDRTEESDQPIYNTLNNDERLREDDACVYNNMADDNDDYDSLWSCRDKEDDFGNYGLFSCKEMDEIMDKPELKCE